MKIKSRYINENPNRRTKPGEFVYYKGTLLKVVEAKRDCSGCYFHHIHESGLKGCVLITPEANYQSFLCVYTTKEGKTKHLHFEKV